MKNNEINKMPEIFERWERIGVLEGLADDDKKIVAYLMERCAVEFVYLHDCNLWGEYLGYNPEYCTWNLNEMIGAIEVLTFPAIRRIVEKENYKGYFCILELVKTLQKKYVEFKEKFKDNEEIDAEAELCVWGAHEFAEMMKVK